MRHSFFRRTAALFLVLSLAMTYMIFPSEGARTVYAASLSISTQPKNVTAKPGVTAKFTVKASGNGTVKYQWYYKKLTNSDWVLWKNRTKASASGKVDSSWNMMQVRCKVSDKSKTKYSNTVTVTVDQPLTITQQPQNITGSNGDSVNFAVKAYGKGTVKYQWYYKKLDSANWTAWANKTSASITSKIEKTWNMMQVRCQIKDSAKTLYSNTAVVTVNQPLTIGTQPANVTVKLNNVATFSVKAYGSGPMSYQWYYKKEGQADWAVWNGQTKATITATANDSWQNMQVRCLIKDSARSVTSNAATVYIEVPLAILEQPQDTVSKAGSNTRVSVKAQGTGNLKYQWYYKKTDATKWTLWEGYTSATASGTANSTWDGMQVYCKVTDALGKSKNSDSAMIMLSGRLRVTKQPQDTTIHSGDTASFRVKAYSENSVTYQWYYKKAGKNWTLWSGKTSAEVSAKADHTWHGMQVKCKVTDSKGNSAESNVAYAMITKQGSKRYFKRTITIAKNYTKVYETVGTKSKVVAKINANKSFEALEWAADANDTTWYRFRYNGKDVWVPRTAVTVKNDYTAIPDRNFSNGGIPIIYISPSKQADNKFAYGNTTEQEQMYRVGKALKKILDEEYYCITYIPSTSLSLGLKNRAYDAYIRESDVYLAIHSNAISSKTVYGAIGYYSTSCNQGKVLSQNIVNEMKKISLKKPTITDPLREGMSAFGGTGYGEVRDPTYYGMVGVLAEVEYHDNKDSAKWIINHTDDIARAIANSLEKTFGLQKKK